MTAHASAHAGGVLSGEIDGGRAGATLEVSASRVRAELSDGQSFEIATGTCELELGGASGRMWFVRDRARDLVLYSESPGFAEALASVSALEPQVHGLLAQRRGARRRSARWVGIALATVALLLVGSYFAVKAAGRAAVLALPTRVDEQLGRVAMSTMRLEGPVVRDPVVVGAIESIVERLAQHADGDFEYRVQVVDAPILNAFALPGGDIVVYTGLIREAESIDGVAGVIAHEMAHVTLRHGIRRVGQAMGLAAAVQVFLGDVGGLSALVIDLVQQGALTSYGRDQERAADAEGMRLLYEAGLDPRALAQIFERLAVEQAELGVEIPAWLSSHPELDERIATVQARANEMGTPRLRPLEVDFEEVRRRIGAESADALPRGASQGGSLPYGSRDS